MLETVTKGFRSAKNRLAGKSEITPELVDESLRDIRVSLLEADVAFDVVKKFVANVREQAIGEVVQTTLTDKAGKKHGANKAWQIQQREVADGRRAPMSRQRLKFIPDEPPDGDNRDQRRHLAEIG